MSKRSQAQALPWHNNTRTKHHIDNHIDSNMAVPTSAEESGTVLVQPPYEANIVMWRPTRRTDTSNKHEYKYKGTRTSSLRRAKTQEKRG